MLFKLEPLIKDIEQRLSALSLRIKGFTKMGLNDNAKFLEPFAARLLNQVYGWKLVDPAPGVPNTKGIDLIDDHDASNMVAVQVSVQETAEKIKHTAKMVKQGKLSGYSKIVVFFFHHVRHRKRKDLEIINISDLIGKLFGRDIADLRGIVALLDEELGKPDAVLFCLAPRSNLPPLHRFFGRKKERARLLRDLDPAAPGWGTLIYGPGGMGKTDLAIKAADLASPGKYDDIIFLSAKITAMDSNGPRDQTSFAVTAFSQMLSDIARRLDKIEIVKAPVEDRPRRLIEALHNTRTLLVFDNLEIMSQADQRSLSSFLYFLPRTCKALLTSRPAVIASRKRLKLDRIDQNAALQILADIARDNNDLKSETRTERVRLINETGGNTLLLIWTASQVGSGQCTTIADALDYLRSCPEGNDPLKFIFSHLLRQFTNEEESIVAALSYPTEPIPISAIAEIAGVDESTTRRALKVLTNLFVVVPQEGEEEHALIPMVAEFIRYARRNVVEVVGARLNERAFQLILANGGKKHERFPALTKNWATIAPALPLLLRGENERLQVACRGLQFYLSFTGRWDERSDFFRKAEQRAVEARDFGNAGWRAFQVGWVHYLRQEIVDLFACADRAAEHWEHFEGTGPRQLSAVHQLKGIGHQMNKNYAEAIRSYRASVDLRLGLDPESVDVAIGLNDLADAQQRSGDLEQAELNFSEALRIATVALYHEGIGYITGNLAGVKLEKQDWPLAESLARRALQVAESDQVGKEEEIALNCRRIATALIRQDQAQEASIYAKRAVAIYTRLQSPEVTPSQATLDECVKQVCSYPYDLTLTHDCISPNSVP